MEYFIEVLTGLGLNEHLAWITALLMSLSILLLSCLVVFKVVDVIIAKVVGKVIKKTRNDWDDLIFEMKVIPRIAQLAPVLAVALLAPLLFQGEKVWTALVDKLVVVYSIVVFVLIVDGIINFAHALYKRRPAAGRVPLTGFVQALKLLVFLGGLVLVVAQLLGESPVVLVSGLGAMTAVLLLIFREPILGFVAGIQLSANNMVKQGDWIQMDGQGVDGDVIEITLTTVKVRNWDKTIVSVPAYDLIQHSFKNWRGINEAGGRRIKRSIHVDLNSIGFLEDEIMDRFSGYRFLQDYMKGKREEVKQFNQKLGETKNIRVDGRNLTNIGTFRAYCTEYLRNHPDLNQQLTLMVRQLEPTSKGLPIQIYCFTKDTSWVPHENIQSDMFDHFLAVLPEFNLTAFQEPSGLDFQEFARKGSSEAND